MKGQLLAALGIVISASSLVPASAVTPPKTNVFSPGVVVFAMSCSANAKAQTLSITNIKNIIFKKGSQVSWSADFGQQGAFTLESDLAPFKSTTVQVNSKFESCKAAISPK